MVFDKSCGAQLKNHDIHTAQPWFGQFVRCKGNLDVWMRPTVESHQKVPDVTCTTYEYTVTRKFVVRISSHL